MYVSLTHNATLFLLAEWLTRIEPMALPDQSNGLVLVEDTIVSPFFIQKLKKKTKDSHKFNIELLVTLTFMEYQLFHTSYLSVIGLGALLIYIPLVSEKQMLLMFSRNHEPY